MSWNSDVLVDSFSHLALSISQQQALWSAIVSRRPVVFVGGPRGDALRFARSLASRWQPTDEEKEALALICETAGVRRPDGAPLRVPHYSSTTEGVLGRVQGGFTRYGEVSLSHGGVLLFDELVDFSPATIQCVGGPLRDGEVIFVGAKGKWTLPARPRFVFGTAGSCACHEDNCHCPADTRARYEARLAKYVGMLGATRIDIQPSFQAPEMFVH